MKVTFARQQPLYLGILEPSFAFCVIWALVVGTYCFLSFISFVCHTPHTQYTCYFKVFFPPQPSQTI